LGWAYGRDALIDTSKKSLKVSKGLMDRVVKCSLEIGLPTTIQNKLFLINGIVELQKQATVPWKGTNVASSPHLLLVYQIIYRSLICGCIALIV
jgi:hypothetical protein